MHFQFFAKKVKNVKIGKNLLQNLAKNWVFKVCTKKLVECLFPKKHNENVISGAHLKNLFFVKFCSKFLFLLHFSSFLAQETLKMDILTSVGSEQHPKAGQNIQHPV